MLRYERAQQCSCFGQCMAFDGWLCTFAQNNRFKYKKCHWYNRTSVISYLKSVRDAFDVSEVRYIQTLHQSFCKWSSNHTLTYCHKWQHPTSDIKTKKKKFKKINIQIWNKKKITNLWWRDFKIIWIICQKHSTHV